MNIKNNSSFYKMSFEEKMKYSILMGKEKSVKVMELQDRSFRPVFDHVVIHIEKYVGKKINHYIRNCASGISLEIDEKIVIKISSIDGLSSDFVNFSDFKSDENIEYSICRVLSSEMFFDLLNAYQD